MSFLICSSIIRIQSHIYISNLSIFINHRWLSNCIMIISKTKHLLKPLNRLLRQITHPITTNQSEKKVILSYLARFLSISSNKFSVLNKSLPFLNTFSNIIKNHLSLAALQEFKFFDYFIREVHLESYNICLILKSLYF